MTTALLPSSSLLSCLAVVGRGLGRYHTCDCGFSLDNMRGVNLLYTNTFVQMILVAHGKLLELYRPDHAAGKMHSVLGESMFSYAAVDGETLLYQGGQYIVYIDKTRLVIMYHSLTISTSASYSLLCHVLTRPQCRRCLE